METLGGIFLIVLSASLSVGLAWLFMWYDRQRDSAELLRLARIARNVRGMVLVDEGNSVLEVDRMGEDQVRVTRGGDSWVLTTDELARVLHQIHR